MRINYGLVLLIILVTGIPKTYAQICTGLGQNPTSSFPVCGTATFNQTSVPICNGSALPGPCGAGLSDKNPYWYHFTCYVSGTLGFLITPNNLGDDYDWQLFDVTGHNPNDVYTDASLFVACNWSGFSGVTGASAGGTSLINCAGNFPILSSMPSIIAGHDYLLMISHYTNTQSGYKLTFTMNTPGGGTAAITDPANPVPKISGASVSCDGSQVTVYFNKSVKCNSLVSDGSDFTISTSPVVSSVIGYGCSTGFDMDSVTLVLSAPLSPGNYTVTAANGADGNTLLDNCDMPIEVGNSAPFTVNPQSPLAMGTVATPTCAPTTLTLNFADPIKCSSVATDGSDFSITGPSAVTITSANAVSCNANGETNTINIQLAGPILTGGNYQLKIVTGTDGNTITGECNTKLSEGNATSFDIAVQSPLPMGTITPPSCTPSSITINFTDAINCNSVASNGSDFVITGPSTVTITSATAVSCTSGETNSIILQLSGPILVTGTYQVQIATGSDGNTLVGDCLRQITVGNSASFTLAAQPDIAMGTITPPACTPQSVTLTFTDLIKCSSIAANGSDFVVTGPSAVTVTAATAVSCSSDETNTVTIQFSAPVLTTGTYQVQVVTGTDGNTLIGECGKKVVAGGSSPFTLAAQPDIAMGTITPPACTPQSVTLTFTDPIKCSSIAANGSDFVVTGPSAVTVTAATAVSCNSDETNTVTIQFSAPVLTTGTYQVQVVTGTDGNTLIGECGKKVVAGGSSPFTLTAQPPLPIGTITPPSCSPSSITLTFPATDGLNCASVATDGSDFIITGPSAVTITSASTSCSTDPATITLQLSAPITTSGTYQLQVVNGTDGNTVTGNCNRTITVGDFSTFIIPDSPPVPMGTLAAITCSPSSLQLTFAAPVRCSSIANDGSDFVISGPSPATVSAAAGTCDANGLSTTITIQLSAPIVKGGNYQLQLIAGSDGNTLLSECNRQTQAASVSFTASDTVSAEFQYTIQYDCETDAITFSHDGQHDVNQWAWIVNGSAAGNAQTLTQSFSAESQNQVQLTVSNGVCSDTYSTSIVLNNKVTIDFTAPETICPNDTAIFINNSKGPIDTWQWTFGNGNTSTDKTPLPQTYPLTGIETLYNVSLTGSNTSGCLATATHIVKVLSNCIIAVPSAFTPNNDGLNDYLYPLNALKADNLDFKVFNRWGQMVFHSTDWRQKWDGTINGIPQATNVYIWMLEFTLKDTKQKYSLKGTSTLIR